jgi:H+/gluconate symporter-like permease
MARSLNFLVKMTRVSGFVLLTVASCGVGFVIGVEWLANTLCKEFAKRSFA